MDIWVGVIATAVGAGIGFLGQARLNRQQASERRSERMVDHEFAVYTEVLGILDEFRLATEEWLADRVHEREPTIDRRALFVRRRAAVTRLRVFGHPSVRDAMESALRDERKAAEAMKDGLVPEPQLWTTYQAVLDAVQRRTDAMRS